MKNHYLVSYLFHSVFYDKDEERLDVIDPRWAITSERLRRFIEKQLEEGMAFVSPDDILRGLDGEKNYILLTFDDGYANNQYLLPLLKEYNIPATFFISADFVRLNKSFWWDVLYRERKRRNSSAEEILREQMGLRPKSYEEIEEYLIGAFGRDALKPIGDTDRPFTPSELRSFAKERYVSLGNHTTDHSTLTGHCASGAKDRILNTQEYLYGLTGIKPSAVSYPFGDYSQDTIMAAKEAGLKLGFTVEPEKNYLPINGSADSNMRLGRFYDINI